MTDTSDVLTADKQALLWLRLRTFELNDPGADSAFSQRVARDNCWTQAFALRVIQEYRRFLLLGQIAGHPVRPSEVVDQVWRLHLTCNHSYEHELCREILDGAFDRGSILDRALADSELEDWYAATLDSYRLWFGDEPAVDIWAQEDGAKKQLPGINRAF